MFECHTVVIRHTVCVLNSLDGGTEYTTFPPSSATREKVIRKWFFMLHIWIHQIKNVHKNTPLQQYYFKYLLLFTPADEKPKQTKPKNTRNHHGQRVIELLRRNIRGNVAERTNCWRRVKGGVNLRNKSTSQAGMVWFRKRVGMQTMSLPSLSGL